MSDFWRHPRLEFLGGPPEPLAKPAAVEVLRASDADLDALGVPRDETGRHVYRQLRSAGWTAEAALAQVLKRHPSDPKPEPVAAPAVSSITSPPDESWRSSLGSAPPSPARVALRARLRAAPAGSPGAAASLSRPRVDRSGSGRINGLAIITEGEALGHGFWIDSKTIDATVRLMAGGRTSGRWTHGNLCADGLGTHLGRWENVRREGRSAVGDFAFSETAKHVKPAGLGVDAATYLMGLAERDPDSAGVSTVLELGEFEDETLTVEERQADKEPRRFARPVRVPRADFVADPAANPDGLFAGTASELSERATSALDEACETFGRDRVLGFIRSYLAGK